MAAREFRPGTVVLDVARAGRRTIGLPDELAKLLRQHKEAQDRE